MQRFEDFRLLGTRQPTPSAADLKATADLKAQRDLLRMKKRLVHEVVGLSREAASAASPPQTTARRARLGGRETRPGGALVGRSGNGNLQVALQRLQSRDPELIATIKRRPDLASNALANLDHVIATLDKEARC